MNNDMNDIHEKGKVNAKKVAMFILYGLITVLLLYFILSMGDIGEIFATLKTANYWWILAAVGMACMYMAFYPLSLVILTWASKAKIKKRETFNIGMIEHFFSGITPFATGGQPFQVYCFSRKKVSVSTSTSLLLMNFMVYMIVNNLFSLTSLIFVKRFVNSATMGIIAAVGFSAYFFVLFVAILLGTSHKLRSLLCRLIDALCHVKWIGKFMTPRADGLKTYFFNVQEAFSELGKKKKAFLGALFTKIIGMGSYYATTFFVLRALYVDAPFSDFIFIMLASSFAITMVAFFPTPGTSGGVELAFQTIIAGIAVGSAPAVASSGMLMWRLITYYFVMFVSLCFYIGFEINMRIKHKNRIPAIATDAAEILPEDGCDANVTESFSDVEITAPHSENAE